ncbi:SDR family NAD(P)-dependent oxidoreductase [Paracoccaceae bacterium GXU_MW_L88]
MKTVLITGCSSGIGRDAARTLRSRGWRVFASCRKEKDCERLRSRGYDSPQIDVNSTESIKNGVNEVLEATGGTLDALINNAAYALPAAMEDFPRQALEEIFSTNLFGAFDMIHHVMPAMRKQGHGRIINVSSILGIETARFRGAYSGTKFALEGMTDALRKEAGPINVILVTPGPIATPIRAKARPHFEKWIDWENSALRDVYENEALPRLYAKSLPANRWVMRPAAVSRKIVIALETDRPRPRYFVTTPTYAADYARRLLPTRLRDYLFRNA